MRELLIILTISICLSLTTKAQTISAVALNAGSYSQNSNIQYSASIGQFLVNTNFKNQKDILLTSLNISIKKKSFNRIRFYPNPNQGLLFFKIKAATIQGNIEIYDLKGKLVIRQNINPISSGVINLQKLQPGIYFLRYKINKEYQITKIIKK